jgi:hypothetical protein
VDLRFPTLLDRYIGRTYLGLLCLVVLAFASIYAVVEFMDLFDDIQHNRVKGKVVVHFYVYHSFWIVHFLMPLAVLVAVLACFGVLSRRNEITAMKAGGISLYRAAFPVVLVALGLSGCLYLLHEVVLPYTNRIAAMDFNVIKGRPPQSSGLLDRRWILGSDNRFYNYDYLSEKKRWVGVPKGGTGRTSRSSGCGSSTWTPIAGSCATSSTPPRPPGTARVTTWSAAGDGPSSHSGSSRRSPPRAPATWSPPPTSAASSPPPTP